MTIVRLGDFAKLQTKKIDNLRSRSFSYVSTENLLPNKNGITFPATSIPTTKKINSYNSGDILVSNIRPYFKKIWMATNSGTHSSDVLNFKTDSSKLTQEYLYTILESDRFFDYVSLTAKGTKMPRGDKNAILDFQFNLPKLDEQKKFSNTILALENKILTLHKINDNLVDVLQTVYHNLLLNSKDKSQLENVANLIKDSVKSEKLQAEPYVPIDTIPMHTLFLNEFRPTTDAKSSLIRFNKRDVLFGSMRAYFHRLSIAPFDGVTRTTTFVIRPKNPNMLPELSLALFEDSFINYASATSKGSTMPYASWEAVKNYEIPLFSETDHHKLESLFTKTFEAVHLNNLEISNLTKIRDALLSKLIN